MKWSEIPSPCPFCGSTIQVPYQTKTGMYARECTGCGCQSPKGYNELEALFLWNKRQKEDES